MAPILDEGRNACVVAASDTSGVIVDADAYYKLFREAARRARRYLLISGWEFDSDCSLLHGEDAQGDACVKLAPFLRSLTKAQPELRIYLLAWDFHSIYAVERELGQEDVFERGGAGQGRIQFEFDADHPVGASHHQKAVIVDGDEAFVGGIDLCANRWDDRRHTGRNPARLNQRGKEYEPYHDLQAYVAGPAARELTRLFQGRWRTATGHELVLPEVAPTGARVRPTHPLPAGPVAISQTLGVSPSREEPVKEIGKLYADAIGAAERLIYVENQYYTSDWVQRALLERLGRGPRLQVVFVLPKRCTALKERVALGVKQGELLEELTRRAAAGGHDLGVYYTADTVDGKEVGTYIHAKLLLVDDRFVTVGSANTTNRSFAVDSELNLSWETADAGDELGRAIAALRVDLFLEHLGRLDDEALRGRLLSHDGLVARLDDLASSGVTKLKRHALRESMVVRALLPRRFAMDPAGVGEGGRALGELLTVANDDWWASVRTGIHRRRHRPHR